MFFLGRGNPERHCEHVGPGRGGEEGGDHPFLLREVEQGSFQPAGPRLPEGWTFCSSIFKCCESGYYTFFLPDMILKVQHLLPLTEL